MLEIVENLQKRIIFKFKFEMLKVQRFKKIEKYHQR